MAYKEPAVPNALILPTGVIGKRCIVLMPNSFNSSSLSIALRKEPVVSSELKSIIPLLFLSFALNVLKFIE